MSNPQQPGKVFPTEDYWFKRSLVIPKEKEWQRFGHADIVKELIKEMMGYYAASPLPASSSIEGRKEEWISIGDYEKLALKKLSDKPVIQMLLNDKKCGSFKDWPSNIHRMIDEAMGATRETRVKLSAPTISKEDERVARNRNTIYTYYQVEFNYCSAFDGDYMICESIDQITDLLKQVDINLDDPEVKATVEIKGIPMTPAEYETWLKENDTSF